MSGFNLQSNEGFAMRWTGARVFYRTVMQWNNDGAGQMGAALAYYALFSIAPCLLIAITIADFFYSSDVVRARVGEHLTELMGEESAKAVQALMDQLTRPEDGGWASILAFAILFLGALSVFFHLRTALSTIWRLVPPTGTTWLGLLFDYVLAAAMVLFVGLILVLSVASNTYLVVITKKLQEELPGYGISWQPIEFASAILYLSLLFALIFRLMSAHRIPWRQVWIGAVVTAVLFTTGKTLLGYYLAYTSTTSAYGAAGSLVAFLIWVYYSSQIVFFGAELIQVWRTRHDWL
jgi:membrane protein